MSIAEVMAGERRWVVLEGDCIMQLESIGSVDHSIMDPPYSDHVHYNGRRGAKGAQVICENRPLGFDSMDPVTMQRVSEHVSRITKRWALVFSDIESCSDWRETMSGVGLDYVRTGIWVRERGAPQFSGDRPAVPCETITICHPSGRKKWNGGGKAAIWFCPTAHHADEAKYHTTQKPLPLMLDLIRDFTDPGDLILDAFCGSGSTGVAALRLGRRFIGIERDPTYAQTSRDRLAAEAEGLTLEAARAGQTSLFGGGS